MKNINILFAINKKYEDQLEFCIHSILKYDEYNFYNFYVIHSGDDIEFSSIENNLKTFKKNFNLVPTQIPSGTFNCLPMNKEFAQHITKETYYRYALDILPQDVEKLIYLDVDILIRGNISPLWDFDVETISGAEDLFAKNLLKNKPKIIPQRIWRSRYNPIPHTHKSSIGLKSINTYVNAGVLLINRKNLGEEILQKLILKTVEMDRKKSLRMQDQDVINAYFKDTMKEFSIEYNYQSNNMIQGTIDTEMVIIAHFTGPLKPWSENMPIKNPSNQYDYLLNEYHNKFQEYRNTLTD